MFSRRKLIVTISGMLLLASVVVLAQHRPGSTKDAPTSTNEQSASTTVAPDFDIPTKDIPWSKYNLVGKWEGPEGFDATWLIFHANGEFELHKFSRPDPMFITNDQQTVTWELDTTKTPAWLDVVVKMNSAADQAKVKEMTGTDHVRMPGIIRIIDENNLQLTINSNPFQGGRPTEFRADAVGTMFMNRVIHWKEGDSHSRKAPD